MRAAILLAGGRGARLGGVDKASLTQHGRTLLKHWIEALSVRGAEEIVVVGPEHLKDQVSMLPYASKEPGGGGDPYVRERPNVTVVREEPAYGGPAAAVYAGMQALQAQTGHVLLLAVDVVDPGPLLNWLLDQAAGSGAEAVVPLDWEGRDQFLSSAVPVQALREQMLGLDAQTVEGGRVRTLLAPIPHRRPVMPAHLGKDVDRPEDARRLGVNLP
ncbi:molybdenum cofactor guanylyltransferase [Nesterenkonia populi]|uniref:molybdenum cofactor guanylyltransferase n=1 Tax=Nesterenkonia populi TaxID=1591087 RepID=UPI00147808AD|nr:NTP transferase domain-containing protein [Nesterenkonia populi]